MNQDEPMVIDTIANDELYEATLAEDEVISEEEPALWPMYLSFGAIAVTVILIFIINLTSKTRKK